MATYGIYQVLDPLYVTPTGSVCSGKIVGGEDEGRIAVKVFDAPLAEDPDEPNWEPKYFLDRAQVQRRVAAAGGGHWAPIYASGFTPQGGAYYVTDYHALTARKLIEGRVALDAAALHALVSSVVAGLEEIQRIAGRSHANLKPSNVLLIGKGKLEELRAQLSDPGQDYKAEKEAEAGDLHALGRLIHELVLHRPPIGPNDPAVGGTEWARLGDKGEAWRQLCAELLAQPLAPRVATLAAVSKAVAALAPPRVRVPQFHLPGMGKRSAAAAASASAKPPQAGRPRGMRGPSRARVRRLLVQGLAVVLLVGGGLFVFSAMEATAREELCAARGAWLGSLAAGLSEPQRREQFETDAHLRRVVDGVDRVQRAGVVCEGGRIRPLGFLQYTRTRDAVAALRQIERDLAPETWPRLQRLRELAIHLEKRGWQQPASFVAQLVEGVRPTPLVSTALSRPSVPAAPAPTLDDDAPGTDAAEEAPLPAGGGSLAGRIERVLRVQPIIEEQAPAAAEQWGRLDAAAAELERSADPVVRGFGALLRSQGVAAVRLTDERFEGLPVLDEHARLAGQVQAALAEDAERPVDAARFDAEIVRAFMDVNDLHLADVQMWLDKRPLYAVRTEDRAREAKRLGEQFAEMRTKVENSAPDAAEKEAFAQAQHDLEVALREFERKPFIAADITGGEFREQVGLIETQIEKLDRYYHAEDPADWLKNLAGVATSSPRIKRHWAGWEDTLRDDASSMAEHRDLFAQNKKRTNDLRDVLEMIDLLPQPPDELTDAFKLAAAQRREQRIGNLLEEVDRVAPALDPDVLKAAQESLRAWFDELAALNATFPIPSKRLLTLDDRPDELWRARNKAFWEDPLVQQLVLPDLQRIQRIQRLRGASRTELVKEATAEGLRPEVTVAAWKLLGESDDVRPFWPHTIEELKTEQALRERVQAAIQPLGDFDRETLQETLDKEGPRRWRRFVEAIAPDETAHAKLAEAHVRWKAFNVDPVALSEMDAPARFNFWLYIAKENASQGNSNRNAVEAGIDSLIEAAADLTGEMEQRGAAMREKLAKLKTPEPFEGRELNNVFALEINGLARPMEFRRVEPSGGTRPFYLGTTEVTLGQFVAALQGTRRWEEALRLDWPHRPDKAARPDGRRGPRVWEWFDPASPLLAPARLWMIDHPENNDFPNEFRASRFNRNVIDPVYGGMPSEQHPMQYVSAQAALYYAAALGCRLPTSAEWRAALEASDQTAETGRWNLRDQTWETYRAYAAKEKIPANRWPDGGAFPGGTPRKPADAPPPSGKGNDSVLLFRPAPPSAEGGAFHDLVGNVAEYVCDRPDHFEKWPDKGTADGIKQFFGDTPDAVAVIGGSALSPPDVKLAVPLPVKRPDLGYSDVGLRLAFTAPGRNLAERLKWAVAGEQYLPPGRTVSASTGPGNDAR